MGEDPNRQGNSRRWITQAVEALLRRLQTDHLDLYQIHRPLPDADIEETLSVLTDLMREARCAPSGHRPSLLPKSWRLKGWQSTGAPPATSPQRKVNDAFGSLKLCESSMHHTHGNSSLANCGSNPLDASGADIAHCEYSW